MPATPLEIDLGRKARQARIDDLKIEIDRLTAERENLIAQQQQQQRDE